MSEGRLEAMVRASLYAVAPDLADQPLDPERPYRDQFEFDSMDFMHYALELHRRSAVPIPERDYPQLDGLAQAVAYLRRHGAVDGD